MVEDKIFPNPILSASLPYAAVNGHLELPLLKGRQRFDAVSTSNLEVYKCWDWWIFTYFIFGHSESSLNNIWSMVNLERTFDLLFYYFLCLKANLDLEKTIRLMNLHPTLFSWWWILTQLFWKRGELMVNPDLTIFWKGEQRWRLEVGRFKLPFDACINV